MRRGLLLPAVLLLAVSAGCSSVRRSRDAVTPPSRDVSAEGPRAGWSSLSGRVRVKDDPTYLTDVLEAQKPPPSQGGYEAYGPRGEAGVTWAEGSPSWYPYGYWAPGFYPGPAGTIPPGLVPPPAQGPVGPFAEPYVRAFPGSDVQQHRPGLSTGTGVYGRNDDPAPTPPPSHRHGR